MQHSKISQSVLLFILLLSITNVFSQIQPGVYISELENETHELKIDGNYFIHSVYEKSPAKFIKTIGGFYSTANDSLRIALEFNSNHTLDSITNQHYEFKTDNDNLVIQEISNTSFKKQPDVNQDLDGAWLFATRGPDEGQKRRGETNTRKTLKFLINGRFQWIAYDTKGMNFKGTGGGNYSATAGIYTENIEYFSRDNARVGASLEFNYELKDDDWHHTGNNSKGKPMYEIWAKRQ